MSISLAGLGWVTPLGAGLDEVWSRLMRGEAAEARPLVNPETGRAHRYAPIPPQLVERLGRQPRLRRASPIAYYSVAAGLSALQHSGLVMTPEIAARTAVLFAVSSGSVVYTRKFFEGVVKHGANAASPMLFPETVYNAPASHLAAQLGIDGYSYTLVGDNSVGLGALKLGEQLLRAGEVDYCLVVGAEEIDWVLCEAYRDWRFGALLAEGAGAVLLTRGPGLVEITQIHDGVSFASRAAAAGATAQVWRELQPSGPFDVVVGSANGSWTDRVEAAALTSRSPGNANLQIGESRVHLENLANQEIGVPRSGVPPLWQPKLRLGEALGASALWQVIVAALALQKGEPSPAHRACVISTGVNQQASGLVLRAPLQNSP